MYKFYKDYYWFNGKPKGKNALSLDEHQQLPLSFRVVVDPYFKRYTVESYCKGVFTTIIYDSAFFDFRKLKLADQASWKKEVIEQSCDEVICLLRDQDDRIILKEKNLFEGELCKRCYMYYPGDKLLSTQKIYYTKLGDETNCVILSDLLDKPIVIKHYLSDEQSGEFTTLTQEKWEFA